MIIAALNESAYETRVALTPSVVKHYTKLGLKVMCEITAGALSGFSDHDYVQMGVSIGERKSILQQANILVCINELSLNNLDGLQPGSLVIGPFDKDANRSSIDQLQKSNINLFSMNLIPRISRAQTMDSLTSQANLAGYRAVIEAVNHYFRAIPMMMTAAGMIQPAKVLILGAGVAGLQAIATARRLGAIVYAFDVRRAAKEQVESLGGQFVEVTAESNSETAGGYASETSEEYKQLQNELIDKHAKQADIVITTALIPGKKAPILLHKATVDQMKPGSVIVDIATARGGNCELSKNNQVVRYKDITIVGDSNLAGKVPATASELYANNILNVVRLLFVENKLVFNEDDEIIKQAMLRANHSSKNKETA